VPLPRRDALALLLVAAALVWLGRPRGAPLEAPPLPAGAAAGAPAPAFALPRAAGGALSSDALRGRVVVLNFWATWCPPCREELPALERVHRALAGEGLAVVAVSVDARPEAVARFAAARGLGFAVLSDPREQVARRYGVAAYPTTVVVDRRGRIAHRAVGAFAWDAPEAVAWLRTLLASGERASGDGAE
jgi:peroxiredoxin